MPRGGDLLTLNLPEPLPATTAQIQWNHEDATYQWRTLTEETYPAEAELGSNTNGDLINSHDVTLEPVRDRGAKILMWHGSVDNLITPVNSLKYYVQVAAHFSNISDAFGLELSAGNTSSSAIFPISRRCSHGFATSGRPASPIAAAARGRSRRTCSTSW